MKKKITITNIWHLTPISTFDAQSKWHEPEIKIGNAALKFIEFAKKKFQIEMFSSNQYYFHYEQANVTTLLAILLAKFFKLRYIKTLIYRKSHAFTPKYDTPRILTLHNSKYISQNWTTLWLYYQSYKIGTCWFKVDDCFVGWANCGWWKKRCILQASI